MTNSATSTEEVATLGGGCFWCLDELFRSLRGVHQVASGFAGGTTANPSYKVVCTGTTGHAEVVQVTFDPSEISYRDLLELFFTMHDPTTLNRQGGDVGTQYRSIILYHSPAQWETAEQVIAELNTAELWDAPIVTEVKAFNAFYSAESVHQEYYRNNPNQPYCAAVIAPKVAKFRKAHLDRLRF